jgi:hypothetical protein
MSRAPAMCQDAPDFEAKTTERRVQFRAWPGDAGDTLFRPSFVRNRRSKEDVLSRFPIGRARRALFSRKLSCGTHLL